MMDFLHWMLFDFIGPVALIVLPVVVLAVLIIGLVKKGGIFALAGMVLVLWAVFDDWLSGGYFRGGFGFFTKNQEAIIIGLGILLFLFPGYLGKKQDGAGDGQVSGAGK